MRKELHLDMKGAGLFSDPPAGGWPKTSPAAGLESETLNRGNGVQTLGWSEARRSNLSSPPRLFRLGKDLLFHAAVFSVVLKAAEPRRPLQVTPTPHWSRRVAFHNDVWGKNNGGTEKMVRSGTLGKLKLAEHVLERIFWYFILMRQILCLQSHCNHRGGNDSIPWTERLSQGVQTYTF